MPGTARIEYSRARRRIIADMRDALVQLVAAESAYAADSGRYTTNPGRPYWHGYPAHTVGPFILLTRNGWWAHLESTDFNVSCAVAVGGDTTIGNTPAGAPVCVGAGGWPAGAR